MNQKGRIRLALSVFIIVIISTILYTVFIQKNSDLPKDPSLYSDSLLAPLSVPTIVTPAPIVNNPTPSSAATLLRGCPEQWYDNRMPAIIDLGTTRASSQYFVYKGVRRELSEFDLNWVNANCSITPSVVY